MCIVAENLVHLFLASWATFELKNLPKLNVLLKWNVTQMWWLLTDYNYVFDNNWYFIRFSVHAPHVCMASPFVLCSIVKQCWIVGSVNLLTLSFIDFQEMWEREKEGKWRQRNRMRENTLTNRGICLMGGIPSRGSFLTTRTAIRGSILTTRIAIREIMYKEV